MRVPRIGLRRGLAMAAVVAAMLPWQVAAAPPAVAASVSVTPTSARPGQSLTFSGSGWTEGAVVTIRWSNGSVLTRANVDGNGFFKRSASVPVPAAVGVHAISVACEDQRSCRDATKTRVNVVNVAPDARDDPPSGRFEVLAGRSFSRSATANDTDANGNLAPGTFRIIVAPRKGKAGSSGGGGFIYTADDRAQGNDSFTYQVCDTAGACDRASVRVDIKAAPPPTTTPSTTVPPTTTTRPPVTTTTRPPTTTTTGPTTTTTTRPGSTTSSSTSTSTSTTAASTTTSTAAGNQPPVAVFDVAVTRRGEAITFDPLLNDADPDGRLDPGSLEIVRPPEHGAATVSGAVIIYEPDEGFAGEDSLIYRVCDDQGSCAQAQAILEVVIPEQPSTTTTATTQPPADCEIEPADVVGFTADPERGAPGDEIELDLEVLAQDEFGCLLPEVQFTFDGGPLGPPVPLEPNPGAHATVVIPAAAAGIHKIGATQLGDTPVALAEIDFEVLAVPGASGGVPGWLPPAAVGGALVAGAAVWRRRRPDFRHLPITEAADPCGAMRQQVEEGQQQAAEAGAGLEAATAGARNARADADAARDELRACREGGVGRDGDMRLMGARPPRQDFAAAGDGFHLLEYENPNAPLQADGHLGWYLPVRPEPIGAVVLHVAQRVGGAGVEGPAMDLATQYTKSPGPHSMHAVVDATGVVPMLPDDYVAMHAPGADDTTLAMEIVLDPAQADDDEALEHAARWFAAKAKEHAIPTRKISREQFLAGAGGIVGVLELAGEDDSFFPWEHFLDLVDAAEALPQPVALSLPLRNRGPDPCAASADAAREAEAAAARADREMTAAQDEARRAEAALEARHAALLDCECRTPAAQIVDEPPASQPPAEEREQRWYLLEHENPYGKLRSNGKRGWYDPLRSEPIQGIVVHTAEGIAAAAVADYLANAKRPVSAHVAIDPAGWVKLLPDDHVAFHARRANDTSLGLLFAYFADAWGAEPLTEGAMLRIGAVWAGLKARLYGIPFRRLTAREWKAGERGFVAHSDVDPRRGSDPGPGFDWDRFLGMARGAGFLPE